MTNLRDKIQQLSPSPLTDGELDFAVRNLLGYVKCLIKMKQELDESCDFDSCVNKETGIFKESKNSAHPNSEKSLQVNDLDNKNTSMTKVVVEVGQCPNFIDLSVFFKRRAEILALGEELNLIKDKLAA